MKRIIALLLAMVMMLSFAACGAGADVESTVAPTTTVPETTAAPTEPPKTMETDKVKIDGFFANTSHTESDGSPLKMVYVFLTFKSSESNFQVDSKYTALTIGSNKYESDFYKNSCQYMPNYYYSSFLEDVYVGNEFKLALTFKVPEGDLKPGKEVILSDSGMPLDGLRFSTDDLVICNDVAEIGAAVDPAGSAKVEKARAMADEATTNKVRNAINGYYFEFYVSVGTNVLKYELEFYAPDKFEVRTPYLTNNGTYEVHNGYVFLYYVTSDTPVEVAYEFENGDIAMYCADAFNIYE